MKTFGVFIVLMVALFFSLPYHWYLRKLWKKNPGKSWEKSRKYVSGFFRTELKIAGCTPEVIGKENIPSDGPVLYVGNHRSYFDILVYHEAIGKPVGFIAKMEMRKLPLLPLYMDDIGCLFLERDNIKQGLEIINQGAEYLKLGHSMILFPEGHRNQGEELLPFKEGGYKMAEKAKCPIVPVAISGSDLLLESAPKKHVRKGKVIIEFGKPIYPMELPPKERKALLATLPDIIQGMRDKHKIN
ncbi:MAG: 1-acyl-sn-glycerol-3-phosphate acyltransferase [Lachnospiraceae bacterium]|nr:1-acyl-sn-glycerol-3-phosphate acyltransferase [Lachnospiraceae bacterium]